MLSSPGHSPRHISFAPSPSHSDVSSSLSNHFRGHNKLPKVLDEDTYVANIEKIIERDFFPEILKLHNRLDWLQALRSGDRVQIRDAQLKIIERRREKFLNRIRTPGSNLNGTLNQTERNLGFAAKDNKESINDSSIIPLTLDEFFRRFTSEDNDSFGKIVEKENKKRKERFGCSTEGEMTESNKKRNRGEALLSEAEKEMRRKGLTKEINRRNTRFHGELMDSRPTEDDTVAVLYYNLVAGETPAAMSNQGKRSEKYDLEDMRKTPNCFYVESTKKSDNGYSFVRTPSPAPGADESPFTTWGEIEGTPLRLDTEDTDVGICGSSDGSHFWMHCLSSREVKAYSLSKEVARKLRHKSKMFQKPPMPSPARGRSGTPTIRSLSLAAHKLMKNAIAKSPCVVDESLRASYRCGSVGYRG